EMKKCVNTYGGDDGGQKPGCDWMAFLGGRQILPASRKKPQSISTIRLVECCRNRKRALVRQVAELSPARSPLVLFVAWGPAASVMGALAVFVFRRHRTRRIRKSDRFRL